MFVFFGFETDSSLSGSASAGRHILVGLGKSEEIKLKGIRKAMSAALGRLQQLKLSTAVFRLPTTSAAAPEHIVDALARMTVLSGYKFDTYITKEDNKIVALQDLGVEVNPATDVAMIEARAKEAKIIAEATNFARFAWLRLKTKNLLTSICTNQRIG
jgi:leucyl aminopeptidase